MFSPWWRERFEWILGQIVHWPEDELDFVTTRRWRKSGRLKGSERMLKVAEG